MNCKKLPAFGTMLYLKGTSSYSTVYSLKLSVKYSEHIDSQ